MRLWHYELIPFLPDKQLRGQWSELNLIFRTYKKHILINYVYEYPEEELWEYSCLVIGEMEKRGFKVKVNYDNLFNYFSVELVHTYLGENQMFTPFKNHHNNRYLLQCFYNLQEKYDRGQKDFSEEKYKKIENFIRSKNIVVK